MTGTPDWRTAALSPDEVIRGISSGMHVFVHGRMRIECLRRGGCLGWATDQP